MAKHHFIVNLLELSAKETHTLGVNARILEAHTLTNNWLVCPTNAGLCNSASPDVRKLLDVVRSKEFVLKDELEFGRLVTMW